MRLTKRDAGGNTGMDCGNCEIKLRESCCSLYLCRNALINKLAAYEDAEEQGRLVILPCKVGDTVFLIEGHSVYKSQVDMITLHDACNGLWLEGTFNRFGLVYFSGEIGRNIFLTREEAEAALKGEKA